MANTIDDALILLHDGWPGSPNPAYGLPANGFLGASHHNVAAAAYPVGTKIRVMNSLIEPLGESIFMYLQVDTTQHADSLIAAKSVCFQSSVTIWYRVNNDISLVHNGNDSLVAVALSAMTNLYYGWFWVGGVACNDIANWNGAASPLGGNYQTDGAVVYGPMIIAAQALVPHVAGFSALLETTVGPGCGNCIAAADA